jgi:hypothetical protein
MDMRKEELVIIGKFDWEKNNATAAKSGRKLILSAKTLYGIIR